MKATPASDLRLLDDWRSRRDADAFREIVSRHASMVYATARRLLGNPADAEDVAQECFTRLATDDAVRIESSLSGWLHHLAVSSARDHLRREARRRGRESRAVAQTARDGGASELEAILPLVDESIDELPDDLRDVLVRHYLEGDSYETIAQRLGMSRRAATYRAQKAIRLVRRRLRSSGVRVAFAALAAALSNGRLDGAPATLQAMLGKVAVAGLQMQPAGRAIVPSSMATSGGSGAVGLSAAKLAGVALAIMALGLGGILLHGLHRHREGEAGGTAVDRAAAETAVARSEVSGPGASLAGVEQPASPKEEPVSPDAQAPALGFVITGRVIDSITKEPLENAIVDLPFEKEVETDSAGGYRLEVGAGNHDIGAAARGYARAHARAVVTDPGETVVDLALDPVVEIDVHVADTDGVPLAGVTVTPSADEDGSHYDDRDSAVTDLRGEAVVLRNSRFGAKGPRFLARKEGYSQKEVSDVETKSDGKQRVAIVLEEVARNARAVMGRVTDSSGDPVTGALVTWNDGSVSYGPGGVVRKETVSTDPEGRYRLEFYHPKTRFSFLAHARGFAPAWVQDADGGTAAAPAPLDFVLHPGHVVEGEVAGEDGESLAGAKVTARGSVGSWNLKDILSTVPHTAITDDRGRFAIQDVPEGFVSLEVSRTGWSSGWFSGLPTGERHRLTLYRPGNVRGRVVDTEGKPVSSFTVKVYRGSNHARGKTSVAFTSSEGRFTFERLQRDPERSTFTFRIEAEGYAPAYLKDVRPE